MKVPYQEKVILSETQKVGVLNYINTHKEFLFGKKRCGVARIDQTKARNQFLVWCKNENVPYTTWKKFETQYNQWRSTAAKNQTARKNETGSRPIPLKK